VLVIPLSGICNTLTYVYIRQLHGDKSKDPAKNLSRSAVAILPRGGGAVVKFRGGAESG